MTSRRHVTVLTAGTPEALGVVRAFIAQQERRRDDAERHRDQAEHARLVAVMAPKTKRQKAGADLVARATVKSSYGRVEA